MGRTRRAVLGMVGAAPLAAGGVLESSGAVSARSRSAGAAVVPNALRPGGEVDRFIARLAERGRFSGSVLLTLHGRTVLARSHGEANKELFIPNTRDTVFMLGSMTKLFTAVAVVRLAQRGELALNGTIGDHLDGFSAEIASTVTLHQLLTHSSGMGDFHSDPGYRRESVGWNSPADVMDGTMAIIRKAKLGYVPGTGQAYSNSGFVVLGAIVAAVTGGSYYDHIREHVFRPAGMTTADFFSAPEWRRNRFIARPYAIEESGERIDALNAHGFYGTPAGGSFASCRDMAAFTRALTGGKLLDAAHTDLVLTPKVPLGGRQTPGQGDGAAVRAGGTPARGAWFTYGATANVSGDRWAVSRNGGSPGVSTELRFFKPANGWTIVAHSNYDLPGRELPAGEIAQYAAGFIRGE